VPNYKEYNMKETLPNGVIVETNPGKKLADEIDERILNEIVEEANKMAQIDCCGVCDAETQQFLHTTKQHFEL
jgi:hypothetical protein